MEPRLALSVGLLVAGFGLAAARGAEPIRPSAASQPDLGETVYAERCEICHGAEGDGNGPAAINMDPRPRDFRRGWYKIRSTASGQLPTDADLIGVITEGMPGTAMPGWGEVLTADQIQAVAEHLKGFSRRFERETPEPIGQLGAPGSSDERIGRGAQIFAGPAAECSKCHGEAGRGDGPSAGDLEDDYGQRIVPADLTSPWTFRGGPSAEQIYLRLKTGLTGSPMPSYAEVLSDEDLWDLAYFVDSLGADASPRLPAFIQAARIEGPVPSSADNPAWEQSPPSYYPLIGQLLREPRNFTPSIAAVWVQAVHNGSELALRLQWNDRFADGGATPDGLAVQLPAALSPSDERPYFVFGQPGKPVNLWVWQAGREAPEEHNAEGIGVRTVQPIQNLGGQGRFEAGRYTLVVVRSLATLDPADLSIPEGRFIPVSLVAWDGAVGEGAESGAIGTWQLLYLEPPVPLTRFAWVPVAFLATVALEWGVTRRVRKSARNKIAS